MTDFDADGRRARRFMLAGTGILALSLAACGSQPDGPPQGTDSGAEIADSRALDAAALAAIDARLDELAEARSRSGFVMMIARDGEVRHVSTAGYADIGDETPMRADTVMRIASMTKPVTAVATMILAEDGALELDQAVSDFIPEFADMRVATSTARDENYEIPTEPLAEPITIEHLLTHTSGLGYIFDYETNLGALYLDRNLYTQRDASLTEAVSSLAELPLYAQPGEEWRYSWSNDVLGAVIEIASGQSFEDFAQERIFQPLDMDSTTFLPDRNREIMERVATLYTHDDAGDLVETPSDLDFASGVDMAAGGAGLFSTAEDYMRFAHMLADGGTLDGVQVLSEASVSAMTEIHVGPDRMGEDANAVDMGFGYSVGVIYEGDGPEPGGLPGDFGWAGYFDTEFVVSPRSGLVAVIMAQEEPGPTTPDNPGARSVFKPMLYETLGETDETG